MTIRPDTRLLVETVVLLRFAAPTLPDRAEPRDPEAGTHEVPEKALATVKLWHRAERRVRSAIAPRCDVCFAGAAPRPLIPRAALLLSCCGKKPEP